MTNRSIPKTLTREFTVEAVRAESRQVDLSFSSEAPVERSFGVEILDHSPGACDLSRLNGKGALLVDHNPSDQVGVVLSAEVKGRRGKATVKFGKSARAEEIFQDVQDGIRTQVSVGYQIDDVKEDPTHSGTYRVTRWTPLEISIVSIPADTTVGIGRSKKLEFMHSNNQDPELDDSNPGELTWSTRRANQCNPAQEKVRRLEINALADSFERYGVPNAKQFAGRCILDGSSIDEFRAEMLAAFPKPKPIVTPDSPSLYGGSSNATQDREVSGFSFLRAIRTFNDKKHFDGLEGEMSRAAEQKQKRSAPQNGIIIPPEVLNYKPQGQRDFNVGSATAGGFTVQTNNAGQSLIEKLRNKPLVMQYGARILTGLTGNVAIPRETGDLTAHWLSETAEVPESDGSFGQLALTPHRVAAYCDISKQLIMQSGIDAESYVRQLMVTTLGLAWDLAALSGSGTAGEPLGLLNQTGMGSVTFGGAPTWAKLVEFETTLADSNADAGSIGFMTTPTVRGKWRTTQKVSGEPLFLWSEGNTVNGYRADVTKQISANRVIYGNWNHLLLAMWDSGMDLIVDPFTKARENLIRVIFQMHGDVGLINPASFVVSTDSGAQ